MLDDDINPPQPPPPSMVHTIVIYMALASAICGVGYNYAKIDENYRRIKDLENQVSSKMSRDDASDFRSRLDRIEDKVDKISTDRRR